MSNVAVVFLGNPKRKFTYKVPPGVEGIKVGALAVVPVGPNFIPELAIISNIDVELAEGVVYKWLINVVDSAAYFKAKDSDVAH